MARPRYCLPLATQLSQSSSESKFSADEALRSPKHVRMVPPRVVPWRDTKAQIEDYLLLDFLSVSESVPFLPPFLPPFVPSFSLSVSVWLNATVAVPVTNTRPSIRLMIIFILSSPFKNRTLSQARR